LTGLILASSSIHRRQLLSRLGLPFTVNQPDIDESARTGEQPQALAARLAAEKAETAATSNAVVIGSDQVAALNGQILRKPETASRAIDQLVACQGHTVDFYTAAAVINGTDGKRASTVDHTRVHFKRLEREALERYVSLENAASCAGGFKAEGLGILLFTGIESTDPTALIGLPMIWLADILMQWGLNPLAGSAAELG